MANPSLQIGNSNWAIKEDNLLGYSKAGTRFVPEPITMTRASAGTRVNSSGLVETVELFGSEEITNGDFATDSNWTKQDGWTISGGQAHFSFTGTGNRNLYQNPTTSGKLYKLTFEITSLTQGSIRNASTSVTDDTFFDTVGVHTQYYTSTGTTLYLKATPDAILSIDNVSVKEVTRNNLARVDYDGTASSLLAEPQRTNLVTNSEELTSTTNVTSSNTTSPDGTLSGLKLNETTSNSQHYGTSYESSVVDDGTIYTISFYIKKGTNDLVKVYTQSSRISASIFITFSTESTSVNGSDVISGSNFMEDAGNGWYRVGFSATANSTGSVSIYLTVKDLTTYVGDVSQYTEYWGAQIEAGSYATSYIPTDGTTVTRVKDQYSKTGISNLINSTSGSFFIELAALNQPPGSQLSISLSGDSSIDRILIYTGSAGGEWRAQFRKDSVNIVSVSKNTTITNQSKVAISWKSGKYLMYIDGIKATNYTAGSETEATTFDADDLKNLQFSPNHNTTSNLFYGKVKQLQVYDTALTDSELETLTT